MNISGKKHKAVNGDNSVFELQKVHLAEYEDKVAQAKEVGCKFSSLNHLSGKAIEHSLPSITQFDKIINHCLKNNLDINDFITFNKKDSEYIEYEHIKEWESLTGNVDEE